MKMLTKLKRTLAPGLRLPGVRGRQRKDCSSASMNSPIPCQYEYLLAEQTLMP
jgi:hypothetical protein